MPRIFRTIGLIAFILLVAGCSASSQPAPDLNDSFARLAKQADEMSATLEAIPDKFELNTPRKVKAANQLLDETADRFAKQAAAFRKAWTTLSGHRDMTGDFDPAHVLAYSQAIERFEAQWERIAANNPPAWERLEPIKQIVEDAA